MYSVGDLFIYDGFLATIEDVYEKSNSVKISFFDILGNYEEKHVRLDQLTEEEIDFNINIDRVKTSYAYRHNLLLLMASRPRTMGTEI